MAMGYKCPECGSNTARKEKGAYHCQKSDCGIVWWGAFDKPAAGQKRKGFHCHHCEKNTVHPIADVAGATIWRCSICGTTIVAESAED
ncbi:hypothetical protein AOR11_24855 [Vibrio alginolyticus]|uniref:hypothetical protein n=1 Tax=Vibrio alginolyticus TaxID=663 RepID=UPI0006CA75E8|nr:hypothetical protein [Vibrio alginolyticus]KPM92548.1 hypothetical protein AOR11_24865 [Vibrio alginolyticus]KPM92551.1 hypothetical protein AOR11_24855 [Vibrio alginolyticus]